MTIDTTPAHPEVVIHTETISLFGWERDWNYASHTVLPRLFGQMVARALPVIKSYHSDLYHDARSLPELVTGEGSSFLWSVRENGTNFNESARIMAAIDSSTVVYRVTIVVEGDGNWLVRFDLLDRLTLAGKKIQARQV